MFIVVVRARPSLALKGPGVSQLQSVVLVVASRKHRRRRCRCRVVTVVAIDAIVGGVGIVVIDIRAGSRGLDRWKCWHRQEDGSRARAVEASPAGIKLSQSCRLVSFGGFAAPRLEV